MNLLAKFGQKRRTRRPMVAGIMSRENVDIKFEYGMSAIGSSLKNLPRAHSQNGNVPENKIKTINNNKIYKIEFSTFQLIIEISLTIGIAAARKLYPINLILATTNVARLLHT